MCRKIYDAYSRVQHNTMIYAVWRLFGYDVYPKVRRKSVHIHRKCGFGVRQSILSLCIKAYVRRIFLVVNSCLVVFDGLCRGLNSGVFDKRIPFYGAARVEICESAYVDQRHLVFGLIDGDVFLE